MQIRFRIGGVKHFLSAVRFDEEVLEEFVQRKKDQTSAKFLVKLRINQERNKKSKNLGKIYSAF